MIFFSKILIHMCIVSYYFISAYGNLTDANLKLELVQVLFRHGARMPLEIDFELTQYNESFYQPWGLAQLTKEGMIQEYELGKMLRKRYKDFLPDLYKAEDLYAYSSNTERTIASLQLVLAALYPPGAEQKWSDDLAWIPIPIHTVPRDLDILMKPDKCPMYIEKLQEVYNSEKIKSSESDLLFRSMSDIFMKPVHYGETFGLYQVLRSHKLLKIPMPQWYTEKLFRSMEKSGEIYLDSLSYTNTLKRLNGGPLVRRFLENIMKSNSNTEKRKIYLYSGHEDRIFAYMKSHNISTFGIPDYGSAIILEKYRSIRNQYYVKLLYWTGDSKQMHVLKLNNCSELCPLRVYSKIVQPSLPSDDEMLCLLKNRSTKNLYEILNADFVK